MQDFLNFVGLHPALTFFISCILACVVIVMGLMIIRLLGRVLRTINIAIRGWPPEHLDADGDWPWNWPWTSDKKMKNKP